MPQSEDTLIKGYSEILDEQGNKILDDDGNPIMMPVRYMTVEETEERDALNIANTASALRARVLKELAKANGHGSLGSTSTP